MIKLEAAQRLIASDDKSDGVPGNAWVLIGSAGRGRQTAWPKANEPGVYKKTTAERILKERKDMAAKIGSSLDWYMHPIDAALRYIGVGNPAYYAVERLQDHYAE